MTSNSQSASAETYSHRLADVVGTIIAMLTLTLPLFVIGHYSPNGIESSNQQPITYNLQRQQD
jgi:hypothetical protein